MKKLVRPDGGSKNSTKASSSAESAGFEAAQSLHGIGENREASEEW